MPKKTAIFHGGSGLSRSKRMVRKAFPRRQRAHGTFLSVLQWACSTPIFGWRRKKQRFPTAAVGASSQQMRMVRKAFPRRRGDFSQQAHDVQVFSCQRRARGNSGILTAAGLCAQGILTAHAGFPDAFAFIGWRWASVSPRAQQKDACVYKRLFRLMRCFFGKSSTWRMRKMRTVPAICPQARTPRYKAPQARTPPQYSPPCRSMRRRPLA